MKTTLLSLFLVAVFCLGSSTGQQRESPGKLEIAKHPLVLEGPSQPQPQRIDLGKLRVEADELARLSQSVPDDVGQIAQGKLPKEALDKLRKIEKLSKHLRTELSP